MTGKSRSMLLQMLTDDFEDDDQSSDVEFITTPTHSDHEEDVKTQEEASKIEEDLKSEKQDKGMSKHSIVWENNIGESLSDLRLFLLNLDGNPDFAIQPAVHISNTKKFCEDIVIDATLLGWPHDSPIHLEYLF